jgi:hypothetical protein
MYFFETPFDETDRNFSRCNVDRPNGALADGRMYIVNHFLDQEIAPGVKIPDRLRAPKTNSKDSIGKQNTLCEGLYGSRAPNFILLDFVDQGDWNKVAGGQESFGGKAKDGACSLLSKVGIKC